MNVFWLCLAWILAAGLLGFGISAIFSAWLRLSRRIFLVPYVILTSIFFYAFARWSNIDFGALLAENWLAGVIAGVLVALFLVRNVRAQPDSRQSSGGQLIFDLAWLGVVYGLIDALFLNVMPVLAVAQGFAEFSWSDSFGGLVLIGGLGLVASLFVALAYHWGYTEFRNRRVGLVLIGNALITLAFVISTNPLGALISHTVMHLAAVMQGPETTIQLPPHLATQKG